MKMNFNETCINCKSKQEFTEYDLKDYCPKIHLFGWSFSGGIRFYTFRETLVFFGFKKQAKVMQCLKCDKIQFECPHCFNLMNEQEGLKERCNECKKYFYICI